MRIDEETGLFLLDETFYARPGGDDIFSIPHRFYDLLGLPHDAEILEIVDRFIEQDKSGFSLEDSMFVGAVLQDLRERAKEADPP